MDKFFQIKIFSLFIGLLMVGDCFSALRADQYTLTGYAQFDFSMSNTVGGVDGFQLRRINLINNFKPYRNIHFLADIEYENGLELSPTGGEGEVKISRGYVEYFFNAHHKVRAGKFLLPFGLLNEVHDFSVAYIPIDLPPIYQKHLISSQGNRGRFFEKYATGIKFSGNFDLSLNSSLDYFLSVSNGRGANADGADANENKALSGRLILNLLDNDLKIGTSFYTDKNKNGIGGLNNSREKTYGLDISREGETLIVQLEALYSQFSTVNKENQEALLAYLLLGINITERVTLYGIQTRSIYDLSNEDNSTQESSVGCSWAVKPDIFLKEQSSFLTGEQGGDENHYQVHKLSISMAF